MQQLTQQQPFNSPQARAFMWSRADPRVHDAQLSEILHALTERYSFVDLQLPAGLPETSAEVQSAVTRFLSSGQQAKLEFALQVHNAVQGLSGLFYGPTVQIAEGVSSAFTALFEWEGVGDVGYGQFGFNYVSEALASMVFKAPEVIRQFEDDLSVSSVAGFRNARFLIPSGQNWYALTFISGDVAAQLEGAYSVFPSPVLSVWNIAEDATSIEFEVQGLALAGFDWLTPPTPLEHAGVAANRMPATAVLPVEVQRPHWEGSYTLSLSDRNGDVRFSETYGYAGGIDTQSLDVTDLVPVVVPPIEAFIMAVTFGDGLSLSVPVTIRSNPLPTEMPEFGPDYQPYFFIFLDGSGSMNNDLPSLRSMFNIFQSLARFYVYQGDAEAAMNRMFLIEENDERWLRWIATPSLYTVTDASDIVILAFLNESNPEYHGDYDAAPQAAYGADWQALKSSLSKRTSVFGRVFNVRGQSGTSPQQDTFLSHLTRAFLAQDGYEPYPLPEFLSWETTLNQADPAYFVGMVLNYLGLSASAIVAEIIGQIDGSGSVVAVPQDLRAMQISQANDSSVSAIFQFLQAARVDQSNWSGNIVAAPQGLVPLVIDQSNGSGSIAGVVRAVYAERVGQSMVTGSVVAVLRFVQANRITQAEASGAITATLRRVTANQITQAEASGAITATFQRVTANQITQAEASGAITATFRRVTANQITQTNASGAITVL